MKIKCGDANPKGNILMLFKGGCGNELDIKDAYRCTGCGGFFHLECIFKHFELEKDHDYARSALTKIKYYANYKLRVKLPLRGKHILKLADQGLDKKLNNKRLNISD
jgi:hypothetical protein